MASVNKVILIGNLGKDVEMRYLANGDAVANMTIATSETWKDKASGEKKEAVEWHRVSFFGRIAEVAGEYLKKGSSVYVEGSIHTRKWTDKEGQERYTTEIKGHELKMLGSAPGERQSGNSGSDGTEGYKRPEPAQSRPKPSFDDLGDDVPFVSNLCEVSDMMGRPKSLMRSRRGERVQGLSGNEAY